MLQFIDIPNDLAGFIAEIGFDFLSSPKEPMANRVFSMSILYKICKKEPELRNELKIVIEDQMPYSTTGFVPEGIKF